MLNAKRPLRIDRRRSIISQMLGRNPNLSQREICDRLTEEYVNPDTGNPWSLGTINGDIQALRAWWRKEAEVNSEEIFARQLAEIREHRRTAWADNNLSEIRQSLALELRLTGTEAAKQIEIYDWRTEAEDKGIDPAGLFEQFIQDAYATLQESDRSTGDGSAE